jgi:hypothetical protein
LKFLLHIILTENGFTAHQIHDSTYTIHANTTTNIYSDLGFSYSHPQYAKGTNEAPTFLAGTYQFQLDEIEVYEKE